MSPILACTRDIFEGETRAQDDGIAATIRLCGKLDLERFRAKRMGAKTIELKASHVSLISHPGEIAGLIVEASGGGR
jgi:hypothetical protein